jgi:hypothetical protein
LDLKKKKRIKKRIKEKKKIINKDIKELQK